MNPTTDSQALLTKTFLYFIPFFFFFFVFSPVNCLCPTATPHHFSLFPIIMSNQCPTTGQQSLLSLSIILFLLSIYNIMQGSHTVTDSQSQKPKTKKKTQTVQTVQFRLQRFSRTTQAPNQLKEKIHKHRSGKDKS